MPTCRGGSTGGPQPPLVEVFGIIASYGLDCHSYADDTQVYISVPAIVADDAAIRATECITHLDDSVDDSEQTKAQCRQNPADLA